MNKNKLKAKDRSRAINEVSSSVQKEIKAQNYR